MKNVLRKWLVAICFVTSIGLVLYQINQKVYNREYTCEFGMVTSDACQLVCKFYYTGKINNEIELPIKTIMQIRTIEKAYTYSMYDFLHNKKVSENIVEAVYKEVLKRYPESLFTINKIEIKLY